MDRVRLKAFGQLSQSREDIGKRRERGEGIPLQFFQNTAFLLDDVITLPNIENAREFRNFGIAGHRLLTANHLFGEQLA